MAETEAELVQGRRGRDQEDQGGLPAQTSVGALRWLLTEIPYLGSMTPVDALRARRIDRVNGTLDALAARFLAQPPFSSMSAPEGWNAAAAVAFKMFKAFKVYGSYGMNILNILNAWNARGSVRA